MTAETFALVCFGVAAYLFVGWSVALLALPHDRPGAVLIVMLTWPVVLGVALVRAIRAGNGEGE